MLKKQVVLKKKLVLDLTHVRQLSSETLGKVVGGAATSSRPGDSDMTSSKTC